MGLAFPVKPFKTRGGVKVPHREGTSDKPSVVLPPPARVTIPMLQHMGAPCKPLVQKGDRVLVGQKIGDADAYLSVPVHASISGTVAQITTVVLPGFGPVEAVVIDGDGQMEVSPQVTPKKVQTAAELLEAARESGLVGLGGAGFPAHAKLDLPPDKTVDTLLINAAECEPYITTDNREMLECADAVLDGICLVLDLLSIPRAILAVEANKPEAIQLLTTLAAKRREPRIGVLTLPAAYPQGAEKVLVQSCTGRQVPPGALPFDVGCLVMNVTSVSTLAKYIKTGMPLVAKRVTVDGPAVQNPQNVIVPVGTSVRDIFAFCGGFRETPKKILMGGPMMGLTLADDGLPLLKQNNGILALGPREARLLEPSACIRCGRCIDCCPMNLMPTRLEKAVEMEDIAKLAALDVTVCMECGCCAYNCPAARPLVHAMRLGKEMVRKGVTK